MMRKFIALTLIALQLFGGVLSHAAFENQGGGGRPTGMAQAFTSVANDANAILYNPAGFWQAGNPEVTAHYGRLLTGLNDGSVISQTMLGWAQEFKQTKGGLGAAYTDLSLSGLYTEKMLAAGYSQTFMNRKLSLGAAFKTLQVSVGQDIFSQNALDNQGNAQIGVVDPVLAGRRSRSASTFDAGMLYKPNAKTSIGMALQNITQPDVGLASENKVPLITRVGVSYLDKEGLLSLDIVRRSVLQGTVDSIFSFGYERSFAISEGNSILARAGLMNGSRQLRQLSFGFGWRGDKLSFDYSFLLPMAGLESSNNTHRLALSYRFNWPFRIAVDLRKAGDKESSKEKKVKAEEPKELKAPPAVEGDSRDLRALYFQFKARWTEYESRKAAGVSFDEKLGLLKAMWAEFGSHPAVLHMINGEIKAIYRENNGGQ